MESLDESFYIPVIVSSPKNLLKATVQSVFPLILGDFAEFGLSLGEPDSVLPSCRQHFFAKGPFFQRANVLQLKDFSRVFK